MGVDLLADCVLLLGSDLGDITDLHEVMVPGDWSVPGRPLYKGLPTAALQQPDLTHSTTHTHTCTSRCTSCVPTVLPAALPAALPVALPAALPAAMSSCTASALPPRPNTLPRQVCPVMAGQVFDTARRKKASANIFADIKQDVLLKLFRRSGDLRAAERANSIVSYANDPERISRALKALQQQDKKDKFTLINGLKRSSIRLH